MLSATLLLLTCTARAQTADRQTLGTGGSSFSSGVLSADYTIGETAIETGTAGSFIISQGFQQAETNSGNIHEAARQVDWRIYPNPTKNSIFLSISTPGTLQLSLNLSNINGQMLLPQAETLTVNGNTQKEINLQHYPSGIYLIHMYDLRGTLLQSIRFEKL